ncbi:hypothetical protein EDD18DRAFT_1326625 [Armillaria luteobubalina]|uniref:Uncharacterized protein n=1 Tax=Armillaria luteobubalina TaxID=153913 RepID=A0AA39QJT0_9AGAR|nr:hypothetical protein EDD18DRAFT_1326625 [Armillaria luteobubalina]
MADQIGTWQSNVSKQISEKHRHAVSGLTAILAYRVHAQRMSAAFLKMDKASSQIFEIFEACGHAAAGYSNWSIEDLVANSRKRDTVLSTSRKRGRKRENNSSSQAKSYHLHLTEVARRSYTSRSEAARNPIPRSVVIWQTGGRKGVTLSPLRTLTVSPVSPDVVDLIATHPLVLYLMDFRFTHGLVLVISDVSPRSLAMVLFGLTWYWMWHRRAQTNAEG